ncbi:ZIP zinc/iron transport family [Phellopilus nigrolimitatus]|nr:ZIP zinc/iron transport family [Phellopilus nigrolimitatus]
MSSTLSSSAAASSATESDSGASGGDDALNCSGGGGSDAFFHLRVASIFIVMAGSMFGALFPVVAHRTRLRNVVPKAAFEFAKYFGSGVIIATAFIHLLDPAIDELGSACLTGAWQEYPWALALCMLSIFSIFFVELVAFRWGTAKLARLGISYDAHGHGHGAAHAAHGPESDEASRAPSDIEKASVAPSKPDAHDHAHAHEDGLGDSALAQIVGIFTLEFGVLLHSILIGLTLAVDPDFKVLFVVIIFHQMFEGLGLGSRLAFLRLPARYDYVAVAAAVLYGLTTPVGIAAGLGVRATYNPGSARASAVAGVLDALSAGILVYTGLVELLAHEFLFSREMARAGSAKLAYASVCMLAGAGLMALLGRWA